MNIPGSGNYLEDMEDQRLRDKQKETKMDVDEEMELIVQKKHNAEYQSWEVACTIAHDMLFIIFATGLIFFFCMLFTGCAQAQVPVDRAVKSIIGEAENQGYEGMLAIAHAIRNRGTLKGVYGFNAPRVKHHLYSMKILQEATLAWEQSAIDFDITHGATGWGNQDDVNKFQMCRWWKNCIVTFKYRQHIFYTEKQRSVAKVHKVLDISTGGV